MRRLALLALAVVGFAVAGYAVFLWPTPTDTTYYLDATPVSESRLGDGHAVAYRNLSTENQQLFRQALGNRTATLDSETPPLNARYIRYDDTYYLTTVRAAHPGDGVGASRLLMFGLGGLGTLLGVFGIVGFWATSWDRSRAREH